MISKCYDEGTIQAFLDGELAPDALEAVARHTAACAACAALLREAEEESAFAFSMLEDELSGLVPTERIRTNLYQAISQIEPPQNSLWTRFFGGFSFSNPSMVAFASLLLVAGIFTALYIRRESQNVGGGEIARTEPPKSSVPSRENPSGAVAPVSTTNGTEESVKSDKNQFSAPSVRRPLYKPVVVNQPTFERTNYRIENSLKDQKLETKDQAPVVQPANIEILPGEESYLKTIATLSENVNSRKDTALRPSERVAFEKDLAVVDDAIKKMREEVRRNPKNEAARQVLRSSYQNKIDLLNSVAERTELMASLQ